VKIVQVRAPTAGMVMKIKVADGAQVTAGTELLVFESMKMEIPVESPRAGTVVKIRVTPEQVFEEGEVLVDLKID
jgi:biotin carboxyl carrier protein